MQHKANFLLRRALIVQVLIWPLNFSCSHNVAEPQPIAAPNPHSQYIPLRVGNSWKYQYFRYSRHLEQDSGLKGIRTWEVVLHSDFDSLKSYTILDTFSGKTWRYNVWGQPPDTSYGVSTTSYFAINVYKDGFVEIGSLLKPAPCVYYLEQENNYRVSNDTLRIGYMHCYMELVKNMGLTKYTYHVATNTRVRVDYELMEQNIKQ